MGNPAERDPRYVTVTRPSQHEGVGRALRQAYMARKDALPADMKFLLDKLDGF